ncbi:GGDEF domain-containing protein [Raoultibacter phocaeensis]|uniref:GGDEF domain-containing protein n=1 Tax=Raoultibacter phocaeensis TaxID=2479841 RepID=UPI001118B383|nr:GGDEF domain-containing protein [Raoultibacter phocaeensis]
MSSDLIPALELIGSLVCYFFFNAAFFTFVVRQSGVGKAKALTHGLLFALNYVAFIVFSMLELNLMVNWTLVFVLFALEVRIVFSLPWSHAMSYAICGAAAGLALTIFARSLFSILLDIPQSRLNNNISGEANLKAIPVAIGFVFGAVLFFCVNRFVGTNRMATVCANRQSRSLFLTMALFAFCYLCTVLLLYYLPDNAIILKLWGMKAAISALLMLSLSLYYAYRAAYLIQCGQESRRLSETIERHRKENDELKALASHDSLTGCYTRVYLEETLGDLLASQGPFGIAFIDIDNLKNANDTFGHDAGNDYILTVTDVLSDFCHGNDDEKLYRYGGDEFVAVFPRLDAARTRARLEEVAHRLRTENESGRFPFPLSISYGVIESRLGETAVSALARADTAMYEHKKRSREDAPKA